MTYAELEQRVARFIGRCGCNGGQVEDGPAGATWTTTCNRCEGTGWPLRDAREVIKLVDGRGPRASQWRTTLHNIAIRRPARDREAATFRLCRAEARAAVGLGSKETR